MAAAPPVLLGHGGWQCKASAVTVQPFRVTVLSAARVARTSSPPGAWRVVSDRRVSASQTLTISGGMKERAAALVAAPQALAVDSHDTLGGRKPESGAQGV